MSRDILPDDLWDQIKRLLPSEPVHDEHGRPRIPDRACLAGILYMLYAGVHWEYLPAEMGGHSGMTCWSRVGEWRKAGVWGDVFRVLLNRLGSADSIDWSRVAVDSAPVRPGLWGRQSREGQQARAASSPAEDGSPSAVPTDDADAYEGPALAADPAAG